MMLTDIQIYGSLSEEQKKCIVHYHVFIFFPTHLLLLLSVLSSSSFCFCPFLFLLDFVSFHATECNLLNSIYFNL